MITIKIEELGNNKIGFYIFNEYNQLVKHFRKDKDNKKKQVELLRKKYMSIGQSVFCNDLTV